MTVSFNGEKRETSAATVSEFLSETGVDADSAIVEYNGDIIDRRDVPLSDGAELNAFRIVSGG